MDTNGKPLTSDEAMRLIRSWLPLLSDRERGQLRAELCQANLVRRENVTPKETNREQ